MGLHESDRRVVKRARGGGGGGLFQGAFFWENPKTDL